MDSKPILNPNILHTAKQFKQALIKAKYPHEQVVVFGSFAKGHPHKDSDLDIAVITTKTEPEFSFQDQMDIAVLAGQIDHNIESHVITSHDYHNPYNTLAHEIRTHGISV